MTSTYEPVRPTAQSGTSKPQIGDIGLSVIGGWLGFWIKIGQTISGDGSRYTHAFVVLDNNEVIEAMPGGAIISPLEKYTGSPFIPMNLDSEQKQAISAIGFGLQGTPYSFMNYIYLSLVFFGIRREWVKKRVSDSGNMNCSQMSDYLQCKVGNHLFDDGRLSQDVTPGDLAAWGLEKNKI